MTHLKRAGALLAGVLLFVFIGMRMIPVPESLTAYGFHANDKEEDRRLWATLPMQYVNTALCNDCHQVQYSTWSGADHRAVSCENCHGPAREHLETRAQPLIDKSREACGLCHARLEARPASFPQVDLSQHGGRAECTTCHDPHDPRAGLPPQVPHALEGRSDCQLCHNPHDPFVLTPPQVPHTLEGRSDCQSCHNQQKPRSAIPPRIPHSLEGRSDCLLCHNASAIKPFPEDHLGRTTDTCLSCHQEK